MYNSYGTFYHNGYSELYHHGVKGQKHGQRRWQNPDGSLTPAGYEHYGYGKRRINKQTGKSEFVINERAVAKREKALAKQNAIQDKREEKGKKATTRQYNAAIWDATNSPSAKKEGRKAALAGFAILTAGNAAAMALTGATLLNPAIGGAIVGASVASNQIKKATKGVQQYRTQSTHAPSKKDTGSKKYDLTFLEYYDQDDKPKTTKQLDHEYAKYKKDPEKWLENLSKKA